MGDRGRSNILMVVGKKDMGVTSVASQAIFCNTRMMIILVL